MQKLNLPPYPIRVQNTGNRTTIFDILRQRYVTLTPEEWVRQHFINYLTRHLGYPTGLLANETEIVIGDKHLRCDSVLYDHNAAPRMIIEYKAPSIKITQKVFDQITAYNLLLRVDYLIISNGIEHYCCKMNYDAGTYTFLQHIPQYSEL